MPTEQIWPKQIFDQNGDEEIFEASLWYRQATSGQDYARQRASSFIPGFGTPFGGWGRVDATTELWVGKTQTWTDAETSIERSEGDSNFNDTTCEFWIYVNNTQVDQIGSTVEGDGATMSIETFTLDVADWGTNFANIENANLRFILSDGGVNSGLALFRIKDFFIKGTYTEPMGGATLNSQEVPRTHTRHNTNWTTFGNESGWFFSEATSEVLVSNNTGMNADPDYDLPPINDATGWSDHSNGETVTQAFFVLEHEVTQAGDDDVVIDLVEGATPTQVEELWSEVDGNGDFTETSSNITTPSDWAIHSVRWREVSLTGLRDDVKPTVHRLWCDMEFDGLVGQTHDVTADPTGALDGVCSIGGPVIVGGSPSWTTESDVTLTLSAGTEFFSKVRPNGALDGTSNYAITYGVPGCHLSGVTPAQASAEALLDAVCGQKVSSATISDTVVVNYSLQLVDVTRLLDRIELPISKANATSRNGAISRASFTIPDVDVHLPLLNSRLDGTMELRAHLTEPDGNVITIPQVVEVSISDIETTREGQLSEIVVSGSKQRTFGAGANWLVQTEGNDSEGRFSDEDFIRTLHDPRVRPGDFIDIRGASQVEIKEIQIELDAQGTRRMTLIPV